MDMTTLLDALGLSRGATVGGFLGALVSLKFIEGLTILARATTVVSGMLAAAYVTPLVLTTGGLSDKIEGAIAFLIGVFGMSLAGALIKAWPEIICAAKERWLR
jgi:hypothetical protein